MSKAVKMVVGVVASIAIPFVAPIIGASIAGLTGLSTTVGSTLAGAAIGAGVAGATGANPLLGAVGGGFGGFMGGGGFDSLRSMFGTAAEGATGLTGAGVDAAVTAPGAVSGVTAADPGALVFNTSGGFTGTPLPGTPGGAAIPTPTFRSDVLLNTSGIGSAAAAAPAAAAPAAAAPAAPAATGFSLSGLAEKVLSNPTGLAQLATVMFNKPPQSLTAAENQALQDTARLAAENQALFETRVMEARQLLQEAVPNPEQAFAQTGMTVERRLQEAQRGRPEASQAAAERRAAIEGTRLGTLAVAEDAARARAATAQGLAALPASAPQGAAGLSLPIYEGLERRRQAYSQDLARATGGLFGNIYGRSA